MIDKSQIENIKRSVDIVDIASSYLTLNKSGSNYFTLCPFHQEKTPSFSINTNLQIYHCFGCNESGDVISLIEKLENIDFNEAIEYLAKKANIQIQREKNYKNPNTDILKANKLAEEYFVFNLQKNPSALKYLEKRGLKKEIVQKFNIGFSTNRNELSNYLIKKGLNKQNLLDYGLSIIKDNILLDKFRNRLIFPIKNIHGETIGFIGRTLKDEIKPKYLNSPETSVFKKSEILYRIDLAKREISKKGFVIITEGNIDVLSSFQIGIENVLGIQGTAISEAHINIIKRYTDKIYFAFDMDQAGYKALERSVKIAEENSMSFKVLNITHAKDIDEYIHKFGKQKYIDLITNAQEYIDFAINYEIKNNPISSYEDKIKIVDSIYPIIENINNNIKKSFYLSLLSKELNIPYEVLKDYKKPKIKKNIDSQKIKFASNEIYFLYLILESNTLKKIGIENIKPEYIKGSNTNKIYQYILDNKVEKDVLISIKEIIYKNIDSQYIKENKDITDKEKDLLTIIKNIKNSYIKDRIDQLKKQIDNNNKNTNILNEIKKLSSEYIV